MNRLALAAFGAALLSLPIAAHPAQKGQTEPAQPAQHQSSDAVWHRSVQVSTRISADGLYDSVQTWEVTVDTPSAARVAAQQTFGYSAGLEDVTLAEAYTRKADGRRIPVGPEAVLHQAVGASEEFPSFSDWQPRTILFPDVQPGDTVHYVLRRHARQALFPSEYETAIRPGPVANVTRADISITTPAAMRLTTAAKGLTADPVQREGSQIIRRWHLDRSEPDGGSVWLEVSTFRDYAQLGAAYAARAAQMAAPTPAIQAKADQLTEGVTDPREQARRLYAYVAQRIRYVAQQHGIGRVVPQRAGAVLSEGYGDCKDHVALLQALLAAKGIVSDPVLISTKSQFTLPKAPTLSVLDHVILYVPGFDLYLDSTSPYAPFGVLPFADYGKPVIIASAEHPRMARTPDLPPDLATTNVRTQIEIDAEGRISGDTVTTASGPAAISLREIASSIESQGPSSAAEDQLRRLGTPGEGAFAFQTPLELGRSYDLRGSFQLEETLDDAEDGRLSIPAGIPVLVRSGGFLVSPSSNENGDHLCYAGRQSEEIRLTLPPGAHIEQMPRSVRISGGYASYHATYRLTGRTLTVRRQLTVTAPRPVCSEAEYTTMHPVMMAVHRDLRAEIGLTPKDSGPASTPSSAAVAQGGVPGAAPQLGTPARLNRPGL